jgi:ribose transport system substrate-binding protein
VITLARPILTTASLLALAMGTGAAQAAESCSAYPTGTAEKIESSDLASKLGGVPKPGKELHFAYVTKTLINEFWQDVAAGVKSEAAKYGVKVDVQAAKDESSMVEQLNLAQTMASQKPDALLLSPESDSNLAPVIKAAIAANIPTVITDDSKTSGSPNARARIKGFKDQLATYPDLQLVASQPGNWDRLTALNATSNILRQNPDLIGIYANNDGMALGVFEAVRNANAAGKALVVGTDGIREAKKSVQAGEMSATVAEFPFEEGQLGVEVALRLLGCQPVPPWVVSPNAVITKDNVAKFPSPQAN